SPRTPSIWRAEGWVPAVTGSCAPSRRAVVTSRVTNGQPWLGKALQRSGLGHVLWLSSEYGTGSESWVIARRGVAGGRTRAGLQDGVVVDAADSAERGSEVPESLQSLLQGRPGGGEAEPKVAGRPEGLAGDRGDQEVLQEPLGDGVGRVQRLPPPALADP